MKQWAAEIFSLLKAYFYWARMKWLLHMEYRFNFIFNSLGSLGWIAGTLITYRLIFNRVEVLAGWNWEQMLVLYGVYNLWWGLMVSFFNGGLNFAHLIRWGRMDRCLLWPGRSWFYASMKFDPETLVHFFTGVAIFAIALRGAEVVLQPVNLILFIVLLFNGLILVYFVSILFGATAFG